MDDARRRWPALWPDRPPHRRSTRICLRPPFAFRQARSGAGCRSGEQVDRSQHEERLEAHLCFRLTYVTREAAAFAPRQPTTRDVLSIITPRRTEMLRSLILAAALLTSVQAAMA